MAARKIKISSSSSMVSSLSNVHHLPYIALGSREYPIDESSLKTVLDIPMDDQSPFKTVLDIPMAMDDESPYINSNKDMISELPNYILYHILSFLSTKDAVKTSILSTNWRYLWTFLSFFHFQMLSKFETLKHRCNVFIVGNFRSLTKLSLQLAKTTLCIPTSVQFPSLQTLILSYATFTIENSFEQFLSRCPLLQNLTLNFCYLFYVEKITIVSSTLRNLEIYIDSWCLNCHDSSEYPVEIDAVNLLYLTCKSYPAAINFRIIKPLTSILAAYIAFGQPFPKQIGKYVSPCSLVLFNGLGAVKFLTLSNQVFMDPLYKNDRLDCLSKFHNLTHLCLDLNIGGLRQEILMKFLLKCPILEVLVIPLACANFTGSSQGLPTPMPPCFKYSFKILHISNFDGFAIKFVKFLLENAILLEEIQITCSKLIAPELNTLEELKDQLEGFGSCAITYL